MTTTLAQRVVERMTDLGGISEEEVVRRMIAQKNVAISQPAFHKIKTGKTLNPKHILALAKALDCNIEWLVRGEGAKQTITGSFSITEINEDKAVFTQHKASTVEPSTLNETASNLEVIKDLIKLASPTTEKNLQEIRRAVIDGKLTDDDIAALAEIARRMKKR